MLRKKISTKKNLLILFKELNIKKNDNIFLHSNSAGILQYAKAKKSKKKLFKLFFDLLIKKIGPNGTLVVPTYNYDFAKGKTFFYDNANSQVGELSNFFLKEYNAKRSLDPIFSHAIKGKLKRKLLLSKTDECFSEESIFKKVVSYNFKIFGFCCLLNTMTLLHYIEKKMKVKYRYDKNFESTFMKKNKKKKIKLKYYVGKKKIDYRLKNHKLEKAFKNLNSFISCDFGNFYCWTITAKSCLNIIEKKISKKNNYLIK